MNRPTRNTLFGGITLCLVIIGFHTCQAKSAGAPQDFDLACAVASAAEVVASRPESDARQTAFQMHWFYIGRLSGRDDGTYWYAIIQGDLARLKEKARNADLYGECLILATKHIS